MTDIIGIMAAGKDGVIGSNGALPWNYPEELEHFKHITLNQIIVMGQKTYETTSREILKNRKALVLSKDINFYLKDAVVFHTLDDFLNYVKNYPSNTKVFMIGGGEIANLFLENDLISSFLLTQIHKTYSGDTYMNLGYFQKWHRTEIKTTKDYTIYLLTNNRKISWNL